MKYEKPRQPRNNRADFDAYLLRQIMIHGPNSESGIKRLDRPSELLYLGKIAYQVKVHRALTSLERRNLVRITNQARTHGGLISKTYSLTNLGLMSLLQESLTADSLTNRDFFVRNLLTISQKSKDLSPFLFGLVQLSAKSDEGKTIEIIIRNFLDWLLSKMGDEPILYSDRDPPGVLKILQETLDHIRGNARLLLQREPVYWTEPTNKKSVDTGSNIAIVSPLDVQFVNYFCDSKTSKDSHDAFEKITRLMKKGDRDATYLVALEDALRTRRHLVLNDLRQLNDLMSIIV